MRYCRLCLCFTSISLQPFYALLYFYLICTIILCFSLSSECRVLSALSDDIFMPSNYSSCSSVDSDIIPSNTSHAHTLNSVLSDLSSPGPGVLSDLSSPGPGVLSDISSPGPGVLGDPSPSGADGNDKYDELKHTVDNPQNTKPSLVEVAHTDFMHSTDSDLPFEIDSAGDEEVDVHKEQAAAPKIKRRKSSSSVSSESDAGEYDLDTNVVTTDKARGEKTPSRDVLSSTGSYDLDKVLEKHGPKRNMTWDVDMTESDSEDTHQNKVGNGSASPLVTPEPDHDKGERRRSEGKHLLSPIEHNAKADGAVKAKEFLRGSFEDVFKKSQSLTSDEGEPESPVMEKPPLPKNKGKRTEVETKQRRSSGDVKADKESPKAVITIEPAIPSIRDARNKLKKQHSFTVDIDGLENRTNKKVYTAKRTSFSGRTDLSRGSSDTSPQNKDSLSKILQKRDSLNTKVFRAGDGY